MPHITYYHISRRYRNSISSVKRMVAEGLGTTTDVEYVVDAKWG